jgi:hypothetical protein
MVCLAALYNRQGLPLETPEQWAEYDRRRAERKERNVLNAREVLFRNAIPWDELGRVGREQVVAFNVVMAGSLVDGSDDVILPFYPEIGKWFTAKGEPRFGVRNLARYITGDESC